MATAIITKKVLGAIYKIIVVNILYFLQCDDNGLECKLNSLSLLLGYVACLDQSKEIKIFVTTPHQPT